MLPIVLSVVIIFLAAIVRGYSGFGFSLLAISALSLIYAPAEFIPSIFLLEIAASLHLLPSIWKDIHWKSLLPLIAGCLFATPFGTYALAHVPAAPMQLVISAFVLAAVALLWAGFKQTRMPSPTAAVAVGAASGLANGAFGIGGPPAILFYFSSPAGNATGRASLITFFLVTDVIGLAFQSTQGLVTRSSVGLAALFLPALLAGVWLGARSFKTADPQTFRTVVLCVLTLLALIGAAKAVYVLVP